MKCLLVFVFQAGSGLQSAPKICLYPLRVFTHEPVSGNIEVGLFADVADDAVTTAKVADHQKVSVMCE